MTTTISITLVLCLVAAECVTLLSADSLVRRVRENVALTAVLSDSINNDQLQRFAETLSSAAYCSDYHFVSREQALEEHIRLLGEDPTEFLGYNPLAASFEIHPTAAYAHPDSVEALTHRLASLPYIDNVTYQRDLLNLLNSGIQEISVGILVAAIVLLMIALVLITNTIRLQIYSQRFLINTMTLVGATSWIIKRPYLRRGMLMGLVASLLALAIVASVVYYFIGGHLGIVLFDYTWQNLTFVAGTVVVSALVMTMLAAFFATGRYIRMKTETMYEV